MTNKNSFERFKSIQNLPSSSLYDYIYQQITLNNLSSDLYFAFLELFWPSFIKYKNHIFLKENLTEAKLLELERQNEKNIEYWINLLTIDSYFNNDEEGSEKADCLSKILAQIWKAKLSIDFPDIEFIIENFEDSEAGDYGLTFYQKPFRS